jgi:hypothetical protein
MLFGTSWERMIEGDDETKRAKRHALKGAHVRLNITCECRCLRNPPETERERPEHSQGACESSQRTCCLRANSNESMI